MSQSCLFRESIAEFVGTFILVFFGTGAVHVAVLTGALQGLFQVAIVWGVAVALAIYAVGAVSGCHINPAITLCMAAFRGFPAKKVAPYILAQVLGAFAAAAVLHAIFAGALEQFEAVKGIVRGAAGSELSAMCYGEYFPNPASELTPESVTLWGAAIIEFIGTAFLAFFVFSITEEKNGGAPAGNFAPVMIGLAVTAIICVIAPLTQSCLNPARDFGPRLFSYFAGWGDIAIPGPRGGFFVVYIAAPIVGGLFGAAVYNLLCRPKACSRE